MTRFMLAVFVLTFVTGCGGGSSTPASLPQAATSLSASRATLSAVAEPESETTQTVPQYVSSSNDLLYVGNTGNNSVTVYRHDAAGNTAPIRVIAGSKTGINAPGQLSEDAQGDLYVANGSGPLASTEPAILVFAHGATGNVAPIRKIAGSKTGLRIIQAMTVDQSTGKIFAIDGDNPPSGGYVYSSLVRFAPNTSGNTAPYARSTANILPVTQLASDSSGTYLIAGEVPNAPTATEFDITSLAKQFANNASTAATDVIQGIGASGIADDPTTKTYLVATGETGLFRLAEKTFGQGPLSPYNALKPPPVSIVTSETCGGQLALGYLRNIYVVHGTENGCSNDSVYVYAPTASGHAAPLRVLHGTATKLDRPFGIYEGQ